MTRAEHVETGAFAPQTSIARRALTLPAPSPTFGYFSNTAIAVSGSNGTELCS
jgi:hypothetical protein